MTKIIFENYETLSGRKVTRVKSSVFYLAALASFIVGILMFDDGNLRAGILLIFTFVPIFLLYPIIRFFFGGKDSLVAVVGTVVVEEVVKKGIINSVNKTEKRKRR